MAYTVLIHIQNEDPMIGEIEDLPGAADQNIRIQNPRRRDGKDISYLQPEVTTLILPWSRIAFIELLPSGAEDQIIGFVRE